MAESQKMVALKKAYAEIILNAAKEAASRVMASEKKAIRYQQDLLTTKDEALRLLVRLKQLIDAKIIEAEIASISQQTKIDELEAQLQEAESVIVDVRAELKWVHDKLDKARNNKVQPLDGKVTSDAESPSYQNAIAEPNVLSPNLELQPLTISDDMKNTLSDQRILDNECCSTERAEQSSVSQYRSYSSHNTELAAVIIRKKNPELHRNGCTRSICALEGNLLDGKLPPSGEADEHELIKSEFVIKAVNKDHENSTISSLKMKKVPSGDAMSTSFTLNADQHETCQPSFQGHCKATRSVYDKMKSGDDWTRLTGDEVKLASLAFLDPGLTLIKCGLNPTSGSTNVRLNTLDRDVKLADDLVKQEYEVPNCVVVNTPLMDSDLVHLNLSEEAVGNAPLAYSELEDDLEDAKPPKESKISPCQVDNNRLLKYTFQRKRKKEALNIPDQNTFFEKSTVKKRDSEKLNGSQESGKSSMINELSGDSRRLPQVARQVDRQVDRQKSDERAAAYL